MALMKIWGEGMDTGAQSHSGVEFGLFFGDHEEKRGNRGERFHYLTNLVTFSITKSNFLTNLMTRNQNPLRNTI